jgi:hypothetical protein
VAEGGHDWFCNWMLNAHIERASFLFLSFLFTSRAPTPYNTAYFSCYIVIYLEFGSCVCAVLPRFMMSSLKTWSVFTILFPLMAGLFQACLNVYQVNRPRYIHVDILEETVWLEYGFHDR